MRSKHAHQLVFPPTGNRLICSSQTVRPRTSIAVRSRGEVQLRPSVHSFRMKVTGTNQLIRSKESLLRLLQLAGDMATN